MEFYKEKADNIIKNFNSDKTLGLTEEKVRINREKFGSNTLSKKRKKSLVARIFDALVEPMMLILVFALIITLGVNVGKAIKGGDGNFFECLGILIAITISTALTVIMEGKSEKAFETLSKLSNSAVTKVLRNGNKIIIPSSEIVVGDIVFLEAGDKVSFDARLISCQDLKVDESSLTGESHAVKKDEKWQTIKDMTLSEQQNMLFSGSFITEGLASAIVTAVGDNAEIGKLASDVASNSTISAPLNEKLQRLGKTVSVFGLVCAGFVFVLSLVRLIVLNEVSFDSVQNIFIESIVLIVAAVPEGLPTTVAISLTLNVVRLSKQNVLIKKLVATETVGAVSVICSDKTGTLTKNQMSVEKLVIKGKNIALNKLNYEPFIINSAINSTAELKGEKVLGSATEGALLLALKKSNIDYNKYRKQAKILKVTPFSSAIKFMETKALVGAEEISYFKGAPEVIIEKCKIELKTAKKILAEIEVEQRRGARAIAFAHKIGESVYFDGYALLADSLREDVIEAVSSCKEAGVKIKILTGDNKQTAKFIADRLEITSGENSVVLAEDIENLTDEELKKVLPNISVIARSLPKTKLRVVKLLQELGEVVAVTGDGVNDAPAIKHADIGICMGNGSEITKKASDVVLIDNSFSTIVKAISFGRNIYSNFQRFITFQLTVNLASISIIIAYLLLGLESPFSSTCLLWLNVIMDGPLALSLGLENRKLSLKNTHPVRRDSNILTNKMLLRIVIHSLFMCAIVAMQELHNFLNVAVLQERTVVITMFVFFQLFNAINCREVVAESALKGIFRNKLLCVMLFLTLFIHISLVEFVPAFFESVHLEPILWLKIIGVCSSVLIFSECYKIIYRSAKKLPFLTKFAIIKKPELT